MSGLSRLLSFAALVVASSLLSACSKDKNEDTSDEGTETDAYGCVVIDRTIVSDLSVPAVGFTFSAADALSSWSDDWVGTLAPVADVQGALRPALVVDDYDDVWMSIYVSGDDGTVSATMEQIATLSLGRSKRTE